MSSERDERPPDHERSAAEPIDPRADVNTESRTTTTEVSLNTDASSGSLSRTEGWSVNNSRAEPNDGRSDTNTTFRWWETPDPERVGQQLHRDPSDRRNWEALAKWNDGVGVPTRKTDNFEADKERWVESFCSYLDLPPYHVERTKWIVSQADLLHTFAPRNLSTEKVILGAISIVADKDTREFDDWIVYRPEFQQLMDDVEINMSTLWDVRELLQDEVDI